MKLTCHTSAVGNACRFEETHSLRSWTEYALTIVSERFRDFEGQNAVAEVTSVDGATQYASCILVPDPIARDRNKRYGTLLLASAAVQEAFERRCSELGVDFGPVLDTFHLKVTVGPGQSVVIDTDVPVTLAARIAGEGEATVGVTVDDALSSVSANPVQNRVITLALDAYATSAQISALVPQITSAETALAIERTARNTYVQYVTDSVKGELPNRIESAIKAKEALMEQVCSERADVVLVAHDSNTLVAYDSRYPYNEGDVAVSHPDLRDKLASRVTYAAFTVHAGNTTIHISHQERDLWNNVYELARLHVSDDFIHINGDERDAWNLSLTDAASSLRRHISDATAVQHVTAEQRAAFKYFADSYVLHTEDADQFPPGYGTPNHVTEAQRTSWNGAKAGLATHVMMFGDGAHIEQDDRISWDALSESVPAHTNDGTIHKDSVESARWALMTTRLEGHLDPENTNPHYLTPETLDVYQRAEFDNYVADELRIAVDAFVDDVQLEYKTLFRFKGVIETPRLLPSGAYANVGDAWRVSRDRKTVDVSGIEKWCSAVYVFDGNAWARTGADVETDFSDVATTAYASTTLTDRLGVHRTSTRPHDYAFANLEGAFADRAEDTERYVASVDGAVLKRGVMDAHVAEPLAHEFALGQLLGPDGVPAGTPEAHVISELVESELEFWKTEIDLLIVGSDLQCAVKYKGVLGVPLVGIGVKTIEYGPAGDVETVESVDEAKFRLGQDATPGDLYSVYGTPIMYVYGGGQWHTVGFQVDQDVVNASVDRVTKLGVWGRFPYVPSAPNPGDEGYEEPVDFEAGHDTDNTAHHSSAWFLEWQNVRENLTSYKVKAFLPEALDRLYGQEVAESGFTVSGGLVGRTVDGAFVPYEDSYGNTISSTLDDGTICSGFPAVEALISATVAGLMPGFATQGPNMLFSFVLGDTVIGTESGDFEEGIAVNPDGSLVDAATGLPIVDSQGNPVFDGYHLTVADFDRRKMRVAWNPVSGLEGGGIHWTPAYDGDGNPTGTMSIPLCTIDENGDPSGILDLTDIAGITETYTTLVTTSPTPEIGTKVWCKSASKLFSFTGDTDVSKSVTSYDEIVDLAFDPTAYVAGTTIFGSRNYHPARYDRYWVSAKSRLFYFSGRGDITGQMIINGRYLNIDCAVVDLDGLARVAVNRGSSAIQAPTAGQTPETMQTQRFYVRSTNRMYVFDWTANHQLSQGELDAVSTRLATEGHDPYTETELQDLGFTASELTSVGENFIVDDMARFGWTATDLASTDLARFGWELASANCWDTPTTKAYIREIITGDPNPPETGDDVAAGNVASYFATEASKKCIVMADGAEVQESVLATAPFSPLALTDTVDGQVVTCYKGVPQLNVYHSSPTLVSGYNGDQVMILRKTRTIVGEYTLTSEAVTTDDGKPIDIVYCRDGGLWYRRDEITADIVIDRLKHSIETYFEKYFGVQYSGMQEFDRPCQSDPVSGFLWYHRTLFDETTKRMFELVFRFRIDNTGLNSEEWTVFETTGLAPATVYHGYASRWISNSQYEYYTLVSGFGVDEMFNRVKSGLFVIEVSCTSGNRMMISAGGGHGARWESGRNNTNTRIGIEHLVTVGTPAYKADYVNLGPDGDADGSQYPFHFSATVFKNRNRVEPVYNTDIFTIPDVNPGDPDEVESLFWLVTGSVQYSNPVLTVFDWRNNQVLLYVLDGDEINPTRTNLRGVRTLGLDGTPAPVTTLSVDKRIYAKATMKIQLSNNAAFPADCGVLLQVDSYVWFFKYSQLNFEFELLASRRFYDILMESNGTLKSYSNQNEANNAARELGSGYFALSELGAWRVAKDYTPTAIGFYCHFAVGPEDTNSFKLVATTDSFIYYYVVDEANHRFIDNPACVCLMPDPRYDPDAYEEYSEDRNYVVGDLVQRDSYVYRCLSAVTAPSTWDPTKWSGMFETFVGRQVIARRGLRDGVIKQWKSSPVQAVFGRTDFVCTAYMQKGNLDRYQPAILDYDGQRTDYGGRILKAKTLVLLRGFRKFRVFMNDGVLSSQEIVPDGDEGRNNGKDVFYSLCSRGHKVGVLGERGKTYRLQCPYCKSTEIVTIKGVLEDEQ